MAFQVSKHSSVLCQKLRPCAEDHGCTGPNSSLPLQEKAASCFGPHPPAQESSCSPLGQGGCLRWPALDVSAGSEAGIGVVSTLSPVHVEHVRRNGLPETILLQDPAFSSSILGCFIVWMYADSATCWSSVSANASILQEDLASLEPWAALPP